MGWKGNIEFSGESLEITNLPSQSQDGHQNILSISQVPHVVCYWLRDETLRRISTRIKPIPSSLLCRIENLDPAIRHCLSDNHPVFWTEVAQLAAVTGPTRINWTEVCPPSSSADQDLPPARLRKTIERAYGMPDGIYCQESIQFYNQDCIAIADAEAPAIETPNSESASDMDDASTDAADAKSMEEQGSCTCSERIFVLFVSWDNGIAYRQHVGIIKAHDWYPLKPERRMIVLG